jgi:hypothetical protein
MQRLFAVDDDAVALEVDGGDGWWFDREAVVQLGECFLDLSGVISSSGGCRSRCRNCQAVTHSAKPRS